MVREVSVEERLRKSVKTEGGICVKLNPLNNVGIPDRLVVLPGGWIVFAEIKKPKGGVIGRLQDHWQDLLVKLGCRHRFVFTHGQVDELMDEWRTRK